MAKGIICALGGWTKGKSRTKDVPTERTVARTTNKSRRGPRRDAKTTTEPVAVAASAAAASGKWNKFRQQEPPQSPVSLTERISDSDTSEAEDEFPLLPVRFRNLAEWIGDDIDDDDDEQDAYYSTITKREIRDRDLRHAEELERHAQELADLHGRLEASAEQHTAEIESMERRFRDESQKREDLLKQALGESQKREDLLERALDYAEKSDEHSSTTKREIRERDLRHAEERKRHAKELADLHGRLETSNGQHQTEIETLERRFHGESQKREDLLEQALSYAEELEASDRKDSMEQNRTIDRLLLKLKQRDATIERLEALHGSISLVYPCELSASYRRRRNSLA